MVNVNGSGEVLTPPLYTAAELMLVCSGACSSHPLPVSWLNSDFLARKGSFYCSNFAFIVISVGLAHL